MQAYNTYINYTYVRDLYNRERCLLDCSGAHLYLFEMLLSGAGEAADLTLLTPTNTTETVQCCYLSEEDCCNGIGPNRVVNRECCSSVFFPPSPFVSALL